MTWGSHCPMCGKVDCKWADGPRCEGATRSDPAPSAIDWKFFLALSSIILAGLIPWTYLIIGVWTR